MLLAPAQLGVPWMSVFTFTALSFRGKPMKLGRCDSSPGRVTRIGQDGLGCAGMTNERNKEQPPWPLSGCNDEAYSRSCPPDATAAHSTPRPRPGAEASPVTLVEGSAPRACPGITCKSWLKPVTWPHSCSGPGKVILVRRSAAAHRERNHDEYVA